MHVEYRLKDAKSHQSDSDTTSANGSVSNLRLRSNLFPSLSVWPGKVGMEISGAVALRKHLLRVAPGIPEQVAAREHLRPWQQAQLAYELPCQKCGAFPEGRVRTREGYIIDFRCPSGTCEYRAARAVLIQIDIAIFGRFQARYGFDISDAVQKALFAFSATVGTGQPLGDRVTQRPVQLTPTQYYLYKFEPLPALSQIVHACLLAWEQNGHA